MEWAAAIRGSLTENLQNLRVGLSCMFVSFRLYTIKAFCCQRSKHLLQPGCMQSNEKGAPLD